MSVEKKTARTLNDLIEIARDGERFYAHAVGEVKDAELSAMFQQIAATKTDIVARLSAVVTSAGERPAEHGTIVGSMQEMYGKLRSSLGDTDYGYVAALEESEDRLLKTFKTSSTDDDVSVAAKEEIAALLPSVQETHAVMRARKHAMKAAQ
jgi:uncharacterized protein (TIGR02284 family)